MKKNTSIKNLRQKQRKYIIIYLNILTGVSSCGTAFLVSKFLISFAIKSLPQLQMYKREFSRIFDILFYAQNATMFSIFFYCAQ